MEDKYKYTKSRFMNRMLVICSLLSIVIILWSQLTHVNTFAATWDQVDFALALERYDLMAMQPHFPGYPYFILGGSFVHFFLNDKVTSLTLFNILFYLSACIPMYKLAREYVPKTNGLLITAICYSSTYLVISVNQPISEGAAIAALWWFFWSLTNSLKKNDFLANSLPLFLLSILLGIRLSYLPFTVGLLYLLYIKWRSNQYNVKQVINSLLIAGFLQFVWVLALIISEGNLKGFVKLSLAFTSGHFNSWGNTAIASNLSLIERVKILIIDNILWTGLTAQSILIAVIYFLIFGLFIYSFKWNRLKQESSMQLAILMCSSYLIWALIAQNIDKPRHILPVILFLLFILFNNLLKEIRNILTYILCIFLLIAQTYCSYKLIIQQTKKYPATIQLANYLKTNEKSAIVYTWEETRVFEYENVPIPHKRIETYELFLHDKSFYKKKKILVTNKAIEGFKTQGINLSGKIKRVKEFKSNPIFDPVYNKIMLYEWISD
jgi:hypothetical protein